MPTKCCWLIHGSLTSERKASTSPSSFINHSTLLLNRALKRQAPCYMHFEVRALDRLRLSESERVDALGLRSVEVIICMITRDFSVISMTSQASLSLSLSLSLSPLSQKSLTHNIGSASALPIMREREGGGETERERERERERDRERERQWERERESERERERQR